MADVLRRDSGIGRPPTGRPACVRRGRTARSGHRRGRRDAGGTTTPSSRAVTSRSSRLRGGRVTRRPRAGTPRPPPRLGTVGRDGAGAGAGGRPRSSGGQIVTRLLTV